MNSIKKNVLLSATALGLVFSFNANADTAVNVLTGINFNQGTSDATLTSERTDITGSIVTVISDNIKNTAYSDGKYNASDASYRVDGKDTLSVTDGAPTTSDYQFTMADGEDPRTLTDAGDGTNLYKSLIAVDGWTSLASATDGTLAGSANYATDEIARNDDQLYTQSTGSYKFQLGATSADDPTAADAAGSYTFASAKTGSDIDLATAGYTLGEGQLMDETANLAYTGYSWNDWNGANHALSSDGLDPAVYTFTNNAGDPDNLGNYITDGVLNLPMTEFDNAATAVSHYNTDKTNYEAEMNVWSGDNISYQAAVSKYNTERQAFDALVDAYDNTETGYKASYDLATSAYNTANTNYQAADAAYDADTVLYGTTNADYAAYNGSVQQAVDDRADKAIDRSLTTDGAVKAAIDNAVNDEANRATAAEGTLQDNIDAEASRATAAEGVLQDNIDAEASRATAAEGVLQDNIDAEASRATAAEGVLQDNIDAEASRATAAEGVLQDNIDAEASRATAAETNLDKAIKAEVNRATGVEGDIANLEATYAGNLASKGSTIAEHFAAVDSRMGKINGLFDGSKVNSTTVKSTTGAGSNLAKGTTVEDHLVSIDNAIGDRTNLGSKNASVNSEVKTSVAAGLKAAGDAIGDADFSTTKYAVGATDLSSAIRQLDSSMAETQAHNDARFAAIDNRIDGLRKEMRQGLAATSALAGLVPLDNSYKTQLSMAMGGYEDKQAVALGGFHYIKDNIILNAGVAYGGSKSTAYKVGVTFGF